MCFHLAGPVAQLRKAGTEAGVEASHLAATAAAGRCRERWGMPVSLVHERAASPSLPSTSALSRDEDPGAGQTTR